MDEKLLLETKRDLLLLYPLFGSEIARTVIEYSKDLVYQTAATDGVKIFVDPDFFKNLNKEERLFVLAHEFMHIKFNHIGRIYDKYGQQRDLNVWYYATDAIINANLEKDGFEIKEEYVSVPNALNYSSEELYEILLREKQEENEKQKDTNKHHKDNNNLGSHELWELSVLNSLNNEDIHESDEFKNNRLERFKQNSQKQRQEVLNKVTSDLQNIVNYGEVFESSKEIDWRLLLKREIEKTETIWSQRRSILENNFAYRLDEYDLLDEAETEVLIDVSGSVSFETIKGFLRLLKPLLRHTKLKVAAFDHRVSPFVEIKNETDIDNFTAPSGGSTDFYKAVDAFTSKPEINKIIFTDGRGTYPNDKKNIDDIIWLIYGPKKQFPPNIKVIYISEEHLKKMISNTKQYLKVKRR